MSYSATRGCGLVVQHTQVRRNRLQYCNIFGQTVQTIIGVVPSDNLIFSNKLSIKSTLALKLRLIVNIKVKMACHGHYITIRNLSNSLAIHRDYDPTHVGQLRFNCIDVGKYNFFFFFNNLCTINKFKKIIGNTEIFTFYTSKIRYQNNS